MSLMPFVGLAAPFTMFAWFAGLITIPIIQMVMVNLTTERVARVIAVGLNPVLVCGLIAYAISATPANKEDRSFPWLLFFPWGVGSMIGTLLVLLIVLH